ncbi:MAG: response regulator [Deltaproteobacteria bacterium]|nr:response regulator [Deltaproteobacteria bacterium]
MKEQNTALILLVDDEQTIRTLLSRALTTLGHVVVTAETVSEACEHLVNREFDLLLIDKNLPDGSGLEIVAEARKKGHRSETIIITGYSDTESAIKAVELAVFRYVRKPFDLDALKVDITNALETGRLRRDLARRTRDLEETNKELWEALKRVFESERRTRQAERLANIGYLAAGVAHEINNPMSLLSMTIPFVSHEIEALISQVEGGVDPEQLASTLGQIAHSIKPTEEAVDFLMRLATDLHSLGRTEKQEPKQVKIAEVAGSAMRLVRHQLKYKAMTSIDVGDDVMVSGHASRLVQVFINLLTNAGRAIQDGLPDENSISIAARVDGEHVIIEVSDTGGGISEEHIDKIFKPFFTFSLKDDDQGSGIGLALVREIVDDHEGVIDVSSKEGEGTVFSIRLPRLTAAVAQPAIMIPGGGEMIRSKRKILFFDTESANLEAYKESFGQMHDVLLARDFSQIKEFVDEHIDSLDALVCELPADEEIRIQLFQDIQRWSELKDRFIFIGDPDEALSEAKSSGYRVLEKPVRPAIVLGTIYRIPPRNADNAD